MQDVFDIISLDLATNKSKSVDLRVFFPLSDLHVIRSTKPVMDTLRARGGSSRIDISIPPIISIKRYRSHPTLDIAPERLSRRRGLTSGPYGGEDINIISLLPPIYPPYGAIDVRYEPLRSEKKYGDIYRRTLPLSLHARRVMRGSLRYLRKKRKPIALTLAIFLSLSFPILFYTKSLLDAAYGDILALRDARSPGEVVELIHSARGNFERANILFAPFRILPGDQIRFATIVLDGGLALTRGLDEVGKSVPLSTSGSLIEVNESLSDSFFRPKSKNIYPLNFIGIEEPTKWLKDNRDVIVSLSLSLKKAGTIYARAEGISQERADEIAHIGRGIAKFAGIIDRYLTYEPDMLALLGAEIPERYIIFNQNRDEIRTNGGFPGSVISFTLFRGNIEDFRTDDVYYYDWNLYPFQQVPPPGLALLSDNYGLRDVNYYPDFRQTLDKANTFIEKSGDPTVTVGIAIHQGMIEDILRDIGPVTLSGVIEPFTHENFSSLMSTLVETRYAEEASAKDILRYFVEAFAKKIHEKRAYEEVIATLERYLEEGEILFASRNNRIESFFSTLRKPLPWQKTSILSGSLVTDTDELLLSESVDLENWVYPLFTSLSGNKSDRLLERKYMSETTSIGDCTFLNRIYISHRHRYTEEYGRQIQNYLSIIGVRDPDTVTKMLSIQGKGKNRTFLRFYVPDSATLTGATSDIVMKDIPEGREISFTLETPPSSIATKTFRYTVKLPSCTPGVVPKAVWYRQPGLKDTTFESQ